MPVSFNVCTIKSRNSLMSASQTCNNELGTEHDAHRGNNQTETGVRVTVRNGNKASEVVEQCRNARGNGVNRIPRA